jgi:signal transduction histidine kinase
MKPKLRNKLFIDTPVQMMLITRVLIHWVIFFALFFLTLLTIEYFFREPGMTIFDCMRIVATKHAVVVVLALALLPVFLYDTIKMSHRFAGPIYRLRKSLKTLAEGNSVEEISFRGKDFWADLSKDFNKVAKRLNQQTSSESGS